MRIGNLPFTPLTPEADIQRGLEWLLDPAVVSRVGYNANFAVLTEDGGTLGTFGAVCHFNLSVDYGDATAIALFAFPVGMPEGRKKVVERYVKWLTEESFAARFFLGRNDNGLILSTDIPSPLVQNIAILIRHIRELPTLYFELFDYLLDKGWSGNLAYPLAFNTAKPANDLKGLMDSKVKDYGGGHRAFRLFSLDSYQNFLVGEFGPTLTPDLSPYRKQRGMYGGLRYCMSLGNYPFNLYGPALTRIYHNPAKDIMADKDIRAAVIAHRQKAFVEAASKIPNPFNPNLRLRPDRLTEEDMTFGEVIEIGFPLLKKKGLLNEC